MFCMFHISLFDRQMYYNDLSISSAIISICFNVIAAHHERLFESRQSSTKPSRLYRGASREPVWSIAESQRLAFQHSETVTRTTGLPFQLFALDAPRGSLPDEPVLALIQKGIQTWRMPGLMEQGIMCWSDSSTEGGTCGPKTQDLPGKSAQCNPR
jgi:hypothetical protein